MKIKSVDQANYDHSYYLGVYGDSFFDEVKGRFVSEHDATYDKISGLGTLKDTDKVIDFGCGNGNLSFLLSTRYHCHIVGLDYSRGAIEVCQKKLAKFNQATGQCHKIEFLNCANEVLPDFHDINVVFLCDVIEHMYDEEITLVFNRIKTWRADGGVRVALKTDNNHYLKLIEPVLSVLGLLLGKKSLGQIIKGCQREKELHVNLTTPGILKRKLSMLGFKEVILEYPVVSRELVDKQLGSMKNIPFLSVLSVWLLKKCNFLSPTFYALYEYGSAID